MLNFVICDDETSMLKRLSFLFEKAFVNNDFDAKIVLKTTDYRDVLSFMASNVANVVVLDIEFKNSQINGLDVAKKIRKFNKDCYIIFITSHFEYVMEAFDYKTFAYLFKNSISLDSISSTLTRLFDDVSGTTSKFIKIDNKGTFVDLNDVQFIEKSGMRLIYHTSHNDYVTYNSFTKVVDTLPKNFVRCHKSFIANINNIVHISLSDNTIVFKNDAVCYIGPKYKNCLMEMIDYDTISK